MNPPHQPSGGSSALKILGIIFLVLLLLGIVLFGSCMLCVVSNPEVRKVSSFMGEAMRLTMNANEAPGTDELRAAGCGEAMVIDMRALLAKADELEREGTRANFQRPEHEWQRVTVLCRVASADRALDCAEVARVYGAAVDNPPASFAVGVQVADARAEPACQGAYAPDGTRVAEIEDPRGLEPVPIAPSPGGAPPAEREPSEDSP